jgi:hypothetical protein
MQPFQTVRVRMVVIAIERFALDDFYNRLCLTGARFAMNKPSPAAVWSIDP